MPDFYMSLWGLFIFGVNQKNTNNCNSKEIVVVSQVLSYRHFTTHPRAPLSCFLFLPYNFLPHTHRCSSLLCCFINLTSQEAKINVFDLQFIKKTVLYSPLSFTPMVSFLSLGVIFMWEG